MSGRRGAVNFAPFLRAQARLRATLLAITERGDLSDPAVHVLVDLRDPAMRARVEALRDASVIARRELIKLLNAAGAPRGRTRKCR